MYGYWACYVRVQGMVSGYWAFILVQFSSYSTIIIWEDTGEYHDLLLLNDVYVHAKDERNYSNSFWVMAKNVTCVRVLVRCL